MSDLNKCQFIGNVGQDPESRKTTDGREVANLSLAVTKTWNDKNGQKQERTEWISSVFFGGLAGVVSKYVKKGSKLYLEGEWQSRKYTNKDGVEVKTVELNVKDMQMLGGKQEQSEYQDSVDMQAPDENDIPF